MKNTLIKICGLTCDEDIAAVNKYKPDYVGFVMFFPKSKRNLTVEKAKSLMSGLDKNIKKIAVVVSPTIEQLIEMQKEAFDYIQIHGELKEEVYDKCVLPIIKAFNVSDMDEIDNYRSKDKIKGFVFDAPAPGSGKAFDWTLLNTVSRDDRLFILSGGLSDVNVCKGIEEVKPDVVDVSSGVEYGDKPGKDPEKIEKFIKAVRGWSDGFIK